MKSSIKIDFIDRGTGVGIEPLIKVQLHKSEDPRDTLIAVLFESLGHEGNILQISYASHSEDGAKTIYIFKPERPATHK